MHSFAAATRGAFASWETQFWLMLMFRPGRQALLRPLP
jgi:hypothetical protein